MHQVLKNNKTVCLNMLIGTLWFYPGKTIEFKSTLDFTEVLQIIGDSRN